ncbi:MoaB/Mog domain-containing protein [Mycena floridula]|nr:MoaB/Mog domain-containing protein [Mycena floridula]
MLSRHSPLFLRTGQHALRRHYSAAPLFPISPVPQNNPLGKGNFVRTAAVLVIGDEILNGKTLDRNSHHFAQYAFRHGIDLQRIEVIPDDQTTIIEASRRMVQNYDLVVTSGGIGPTHDDKTYASLAKAFNQSQVHHAETQRRMDEMNKHAPWVANQNASQRHCYEKMALFPEQAEVLFVQPDIWVPVVRLEGKLCILPGIPALFQRLLRGLTPYLLLPPSIERPMRIQIFTKQSESMIAPYLTTLQARMKKHGIQVGSYPVVGQAGVFVSLVGRDQHLHQDPQLPRTWLAQAAYEVEKELEGRIVTEEEVAKKKEEAKRNCGTSIVVMQTMV